MSKIFEELPSSWEMVRLGDFVDYEKGKKPKHQQDTKDSRYCYPYIDIEAFEENIIKSYADGTNCKMCSEDDFLMVWDGSRSGLVGNGMNGALGSTLVRINFPLILNNYAFYFLFSKYIQINSRAKGSGTPHVDPDLLWNYEFPVAPSNEQNRIVSKIEELFSELDKGIESLKTAREQLKVYRQALLKHAFEGKLTEQWRKDNAAKLETADQLLERIKQEREVRYQQQLDDWKDAVKQWEASGKEGKKPRAPLKIKNMELLSNDDISSLPIIPKNWLWVKYGDMCSIVKNGISKKPVGDTGDKIFRISAVRPMFFNMSDYRIIDNSNGEFDNYYLQKNDLVFTRYNGSRRYVGVCAYFKSNEKRLIPDKLVQTRPDLPMLSASYFEKALNSGGSRKFIESKIRTTAGQSGVSGGDIKNIPVPVCSRNEQVEIASRLDAMLSVLDENEKMIEVELIKSESLRQSILKKAFSGKLVPQDPNDEAASELLKRIAQEKAELEAREKAAKAANKKATKKIPLNPPLPQGHLVKKGEVKSKRKKATTRTL